MSLPPQSQLILGSAETILGFNRGAEAFADIRGDLITDGRLFVGRNNAQSTLLLSGSILSSSLVQLSQYDSSEDTRAEIVVTGGKFQAQALKLIHDQTSVTLEGGSITVDEFHLGGDNWEALVTVTRGELKAKELLLGGGKGKSTFQQSGGTVKVETIHRDGGSYELVSPQAQLWVKMGAEQLVHFLPEIPRSTRGEWTVFSHTR